MSKILVLTGATGKKSGGAQTENIGKNLDKVQSMFPDGVRAIVKDTSDTTELNRLIPNVQKFIGGYRRVEYYFLYFQPCAV